MVQNKTHTTATMLTGADKKNQKDEQAKLEAINEHNKTRWLADLLISEQLKLEWQRAVSLSSSDAGICTRRAIAHS